METAINHLPEATAESAVHSRIQSAAPTLQYLFGPFRFIPGRRTLLCAGTPQRVGGRALDILRVLLERPGETISKRELIARVWPTTVVEDSNLKVHVAALRRMLGEFEHGWNYISTVNGRGYCFIGPVRTTRAAASAGADLPAGQPGGAVAARARPDSTLGIVAEVATQLRALQDALEAIRKERDHYRIELQSVRAQLEGAIGHAAPAGSWPEQAGAGAGTSLYS